MNTLDIIHGIAVFSYDDGQVITTRNLKTIKNNAELTVFLEEMLMRPWFTDSMRHQIIRFVTNHNNQF